MTLALTLLSLEDLAGLTLDALASMLLDPAPFGPVWFMEAASAYAPGQAAGSVFAVGAIVGDVQ